jgi:hypothetical protein
MEELVKRMAIEIEKQKEKLLFNRICERVQTNEPIDFQMESKRMFPRIKAIHNNIENSEHYYWNDGSFEGLHLISFYYNNGITDDFKTLFNYK